MDFQNWLSVAELQSETQGFFANPDLFYLLLVAGLLGIALEFIHPGGFIAGTLGALSLVLAVIGGTALPINMGASILILASIIFMVAEIFVPSFGLLGIVGFVGFVIGSLFLIDQDNVQGLTISLYTILPTCLLLATFFIGISVILVRSHKRLPANNDDMVIGSVGVATEDFQGNLGLVRLDGELWTAQVEQGTLVRRGDRLGVVKRDGLKLGVRLLDT